VEEVAANTLTDVYVKKYTELSGINEATSKAKFLEYGYYSMNGIVY